MVGELDLDITPQGPDAHPPNGQNSTLGHKCILRGQRLVYLPPLVGWNAHKITPRNGGGKCANIDGHLDVNNGHGELVERANGQNGS